MLRLALSIMLPAALVCGCDSREGPHPTSQPALQTGTDMSEVAQPASDHRGPTLRVAKDWPPGKTAPEQAAQANSPEAAATAATTKPGETDTPSAFRPLADAQVGEWATYSALNGQTIRYEVVEIEGDRVRIRVEVRDGGKTVGMPATREERRDFDPLAKVATVQGGTRSVTPARIEAAGRTWDATLYEDHWLSEDIQYVRKTWVSEAAPIFGTLRMELTGDGALEAKLELAAYGSDAPR